MSKSFSSLSAEEQSTLIANIRGLLAKHGLTAEIMSVREVVSNLKAGGLEDNYSLVVKKELSPAQKEAADAFNEEVKGLIQGVSDVEIQMVCQVGAGMTYQTIEKVTSINSDDAVSLVHTPGEVWLLDFWATWCPPCQAPMAHNQLMLEKKGEEWKAKKIRIIGLSIDNTRDAVVNHVNAKNWNSVEHFHRAQSDCSKVYGVRGVPHVMLVDQQGTIVYKGHPASRPDLEGDLEKLAAGEKLTGEGIQELKAAAAAGSADAPEVVPEGFKEINLEQVTEEVEQFKKVNEGYFSNEDLKTAANGLMRAFCVIVLQTRYLSDKTVSQYQNYRVLVGAKDGIDKYSAAFENDLKGSWEVQNQIREM